MKEKHTHFSGTVSTLKDVDGQTSHQSWEDLVKLFKILQRIEHQRFLCCLSSLALVFSKFFTKQSQVAWFKHHLQQQKETSTQHCVQIWIFIVPTASWNDGPCNRMQRFHPPPSELCCGWVYLMSTWHPGGGPSWLLWGRAELHPARSSERFGVGSPWCGHDEDRSCHGQMPVWEKTWFRTRLKTRLTTPSP